MKVTTIQGLAKTLPRKEFARLIGSQRPAAAMIAHGHRKMSLEALARFTHSYLVPTLGEKRAAAFLLRSLREWFPESETSNEAQA